MSDTRRSLRGGSSARESSSRWESQHYSNHALGWRVDLWVPDCTAKGDGRPRISAVDMGMGIAARWRMFGNGIQAAPSATPWRIAEVMLSQVWDVSVPCDVQVHPLWLCSMGSIFEYPYVPNHSICVLIRMIALCVMASMKSRISIISCLRTTIIFRPVKSGLSIRAYCPHPLHLGCDSARMYVRNGADHLVALQWEPKPIPATQANASFNKSG